MSETLRYDELAEALSRLGFTQDAAEYHGALCGALCVKEPVEIDLLKLLEGAKGAGDAAAAAQALTRLRSESANAFSDAELGFEPLLPDDEEELQKRVQALSAWCEGFLYGLASGKPLSMKSVSPEMKEIVSDFTEFTKAGVGDDEDTELEENAYAELVEYVRVGAQLIYLELHERAPSRVH
ncbi:MAG: UPF0149 family protein [Gammaproteobacteria bacterium]